MLIFILENDTNILNSTIFKFCPNNSCKLIVICHIHIFHSQGSMLAPHVNPISDEYTIVLSGYGELHIGYPNGSKAMKTKIKQGDVFVVPRYFPFCQVASRDGPLEFFGFSTSARKNKPQFLAGAASLLRTLMGPELSAAFGVSEDTLRRAVDAQHEAVILPSAWAAPPENAGKLKMEEEPNAIRSFANDVVMDVY